MVLGEEYCRCNPESPQSEKNRLATEKFAKALSRKYSVDLWLSRQGVNDEFLIVSGITVPEDQRNEGIGTQVMEEVIAWGHARGLTLALTPEPIENRGSVRAKNRLIRFYRRLGFVPNKGRNREFRIRESMIFRPNRSNPDGPLLPVSLPQDSLLPAIPIAAEISSNDVLIPRASLALMASGKFTLIRVPEGHLWMVKSNTVRDMTKLMSRSGLANPQYWYDLLASCSTSANLYVMDAHGERYKVLDVEIDPGGETGELVLQHLGRRSRQGSMRVDIHEGYGKMLPFVVYKQQNF